MSQPADEYPTFQNADVLIISMSGKIWKLHSRVLAVNSGDFKTSLAKNPPAKIRREDKVEGNLIQWKFQMIKHPSAARFDPRGLHYADFMALDPRKTQPLAFGLITAMEENSKFDTIYDNIFRIFYNKTPDFTAHPDNDDITAPMHEALNLLTAAGFLKAYPAVRQVVESFLLSFNQLLWFQVEHCPEVWASVGCKLQSPTIFREAMLHLAGRWHLKGKDGVKQEILRNIEFGHEVLDLTRLKGRELKDYKLQAERYLFEFVPERMRHEAKDTVTGIVAPARNVYANDVYWWMSLNLIRQYFVSAVLQNQHHRASDGGIAFYRTIAAPHSYLLDDALDSFHAMFAMTPKSKVVFIHALNELKKDIAPIVQGLLVNHSLARKEADALPYGYLACTVILDEELPWVESVPSTTPVSVVGNDMNALDPVLENGNKEQVVTAQVVAKFPKPPTENSQDPTVMGRPKHISKDTTKNPAGDLKSNGTATQNITSNHPTAVHRPNPAPISSPTQSTSQPPISQSSKPKANLSKRPLPASTQEPPPPAKQSRLTSSTPSNQVTSTPTHTPNPTKPPSPQRSSTPQTPSADPDSIMRGLLGRPYGKSTPSTSSTQSNIISSSQPRNPNINETMG